MVNNTNREATLDSVLEVLHVINDKIQEPSSRSGGEKVGAHPLGEYTALSKLIPSFTSSFKFAIKSSSLLNSSLVAAKNNLLATSKSMFDDVRLRGMILMDDIGGLAQRSISSITTPVKSMIESVALRGLGMVDKIKGGFDEIRETVSLPFKKIKGIYEALSPAKLLSSMGGFFKNTLGKVSGLFKGKDKTTDTKVPILLREIKDISTKIFDFLVDAQKDPALVEEHRKEQLSIFKSIAESLRVKGATNNSSKSKTDEDKFGFFETLLGLGASSQIISSVQGFVTRTRKFVSSIFGGKGWIAKTFSKVGSFLSKMAKGGMKLFKIVFTGFDESMKVVNKVSRYLPNIIKPLLKIAPKLLSAFGAVARLIAWPVTIVMGLYGAVTGFIDGYKEDGIIGGIKGAIVGIFDTLVGGLLDMIKGGVSWLAGMLGFENVAGFLDSFSFSELFKDYVDGVFNILTLTADFLMNIPSWIGEKMSAIGEFLKPFVSGFVDKMMSVFTFLGDILFFIPRKIGSFIGKIPDMLEGFMGQTGELINKLGEKFNSLKDRFFKVILKSILPNRDGNRIEKLIGGAIPDSVYRFANQPVPRSADEDLTLPSMRKVQQSAEIGKVTSDSGKLLKETSKAVSNNVVVNNFNSGGNTTVSAPTVNNANISTSRVPVTTGGNMAAAL